MGIGRLGEERSALPVLWRQPPEGAYARVVVSPARRVHAADPPPPPTSTHTLLGVDRLRAAYSLDPPPRRLLDMYV